MFRAIEKSTSVIFECENLQTVYKTAMYELRNLEENETITFMKIDEEGNEHFLFCLCLFYYDPKVYGFGSYIIFANAKTDPITIWRKKVQ